jgi:DNA-directed DNA polymerase III PolC
MVTSFVPLRCRSNFSFFYGPVTIERLTERLGHLGYWAACLADSDGLYGAVRFFDKAGRAGIKPLIGIEMEIAAGHHVNYNCQDHRGLDLQKLISPHPALSLGERVPEGRVRAPVRPQLSRLLFIAKNLKGYGSLCRLSTIRMLDERPPSLEDIAANSSGVIAVALDIKAAENLKDIFADDLYIGLESSDDLATRQTTRAKIAHAEKLSIRTVAADPAYFIDKDDIPVHRALAAIKNLTTIDNIADKQLAPPDSFLYPPQQMAWRYREYPEALLSTLEIADKCRLELPIGRLNFPSYENKSGISNAQLLRQKAEAGLYRRYDKFTGEVYSRFESELATIHQSGFDDYFLIVSEIVDHCHESGIPVVGRGSAASSIISYALGITEVDPIAQNLYFARFLNEARTDPPDVDLDICWRKRDDVLDFVYEKYGRNRVAMIATLNTFAARGAIRELGKVFGLSGDELLDITKRLPWGKLGDLAKTARDYPECRDLPLDKEPYKTIIELAHKIEGFPRHLSIHCGGVVIAPGELLDIVPLQLSAKGIAITQYDMYDIAALGLVKIDLLGQRGLSTIGDAEFFAQEKTGQPITYDYDDPATFDLLQHGRTIGVFQIESPGLRSLLIEMQPKNLNDITLALALIRPGAAESGMKKIFLERLAGERPVEYPHPSLEPVLKETLGNIIYQEQVLRTAEAMAGFSPGQADLLRKAMTKERDVAEFRAFADKFLTQATARGVPPLKAREVFALLTKFASYGFCKAHAATYAMLSYRASFLKAHFPIEFMAAMLNNFAGYYAHFVYADEARRLGAKLLPPDIDKPSRLCTVEGKCLQIGLAFVKGLSTATIDKIISERAKAKFISLADFLIRVRPGKDEAVNLIRIGALDYLGGTRPSLLWYMKLHGEKILKHQADLLDLGDFWAPQLPFAPKLPDYSLAEKLTAEQEILEMAISCHPTELIAGRDNCVKSVELASRQGKDVRVIGMVVDRKRIKTNNRHLMVFLTMEDNQDYFEVTVFPEVYKKFGARIFRKPILEVTGKAQAKHGVLTVIASDLRACA